ncbi:MAG: hypothetical protein ACTSXL_03680 [Alphaproteobacteria bacterium]
MQHSDKKVFLSVIDGGLLKPRKIEKKIRKTFSTPEMNYQINLKKLAYSYQNFLKLS